MRKVSRTVDHEELEKLGEFPLIELFQREQTDLVFKEIYRRYCPLVYGYLKRCAYHARETVIEELTDDVFISVHRNIGGIKNIAGFRSWICRISHNICVNYFKKKKEICLDTEASERIQDERIDIEAGPVRDEMNESIHEEIGKFDPLTREIIVLKCYQDLTHEEISGVLKIPVRKIKYLLKKAVIRMHQNLKKEDLMP